MLTVRRLVCAIAACIPLVARAEVTTASSDAFRIYCFEGSPPAEDVLRQCISLRSELQQTWLRKLRIPKWQPPCEVVIHASSKSYLRAVGESGRQTFGSSLIKFQRGQIARRRLDLLIDEKGQVPALGHELTHVVLADRFPGQQIPRWVDEGIALLADSREKRNLHRADFVAHARYGQAMRLAHLMTLDAPLKEEQVPTFYGQSLSLIEFLLQQDAPETLFQFVELSSQHGYDHALQKCYGFRDLSRLEREWHQHTVAATHELKSVQMFHASYQGTAN